MCKCCYTVPQAQVGIVERFGKFHRLDQPGIHCLCNCCGAGDRVAAKISLKLQQLDVRVETKSKDNVFMHLMVSVQFQVERDQVYTAHYRLTNPAQQITAYVFDVVRATVPKIELDAVFEQKDDIAISVKNELAHAMKQFGFNIHQALVTDIDPDHNVKRAMNEINAARRQRDAATDRAEAEKILKVKAAEADAESCYLHGVGIARQRRAIIDGLRDSVMDFSESIHGSSAKDVMDLVLLTQYFDTMKDLGMASNSSTIFMPHNPSAVNDLKGQMTEGFMTALAASGKQIGGDSKA